MRHPDWKHTVLFGDSACLCDSGTQCRACRGEPTPQLQPGFGPITYVDLIATRDPGDYIGRHEARAMTTVEV